MSGSYKYAIVKVCPSSNSIDYNNRQPNDANGAVVDIFLKPLIFVFSLAFKSIHILFRIYILKENIGFASAFSAYMNERNRLAKERSLPSIYYEIVGETQSIKVNSESEIIAKLGTQGYIIYDRKDEIMNFGNKSWINKVIHLRKEIT